MIKTVSIAFVFLFLLAGVVSAQVPEKGEIEKLEQGQFTFAKGKVQATLADTVSREFIQRKFKDLGFDIISLDIRPIHATMSDTVSDSLLTNLSEHPFIKKINIHEWVQYDQTSVDILFNPFVTKQMVNDLASSYQEFSLRNIAFTPRTVVVKTKEREEEKVMERLKQLPYVKNTAYIGVIQN